MLWGWEELGWRGLGTQAGESVLSRMPRGCPRSPGHSRRPDPCWPRPHPGLCPGGQQVRLSPEEGRVSWSRGSHPCRPSQAPPCPWAGSRQLKEPLVPGHTRPLGSPGDKPGQPAPLKGQRPKGKAG